jgi:hypothetical protein
VSIETVSGQSIERGFATSIHGVWCYRATTTAPTGESLIITAIARDRPGHEGATTSVMPT